MGPWPPDEEHEYSEPQDEGQSPFPVAFVSTQQSIPLQVDEVADERTPEGMVCMGTFFNERLIARSIISPEALAEIEHQDVFAVPVRLGLAAVENVPGLQCRLYALLPATQFLEAEDEPEEPWLASVPRFEDVAQQEEKAEEEAIVPLLLGHIVRFQRDRRHPDNLAAEAADILRAILSEERPLTDVIDKILEEL